MLFSQELMNDKPRVIATLGVNQWQRPTSYPIKTYSAKAADPGSQFWLEKLQLQISGGSARAHPQGTLSWTCSYLQDSLISAAEPHHPPFPVHWLNVHEEYFPLTDVGSETSTPCVCSVNPLVHCQEKCFLPIDIKPADPEAFDSNEFRII